MPGADETTHIAANTVVVWDLPIRLFHWLLVGLIVFAWWSAETDHLAWHKIAGSGVAGLFASDTDGVESGPLSNWVDYDGSRLASKIHGYAFEALEILIGLHILAILFYTFAKRHPLVPAMIHGRTPAKNGELPLTRGGGLSLAIGLALGAITAGVLIWLSGKS